MVASGYLVELEDNSFTNETHVFVTDRYYNKYKHAPEFITANRIVRCLDLQDEIDKNPWVEVWR